MEEQKEMYDLLDMMIQPVFCVKNGRIVRVNPAAKQLLLNEGDPVGPLLALGAEEYAAFEGGCLYMTLSVNGQHFRVAIRRIDGLDIFRLDQDNTSMQAMALASCHLRKPLGNALSLTEALLEEQTDPNTVSQLSMLNRSLYQMLRTLGNMSDADSDVPFCEMETMDAPAVFREIFEKARTLAEHSGRQLKFQELNESIYCLIDRDQLERAVLNMLSNAMKFTPKDGMVDASLTRRGRTLVLTVQDSGSGIAREIMGDLFLRYLRHPGIEDSRFGIGLGIRMVHKAATKHGGTLLITQEENGGTRIVMTLAIRQKTDTRLSSPVFSFDYTGGFDHSLVELSEVLSAELYDGTF